MAKLCLFIYRVANARRAPMLVRYPEPAFQNFPSSQDHVVIIILIGNLHIFIGRNRNTRVRPQAVNAVVRVTVAAPPCGRYTGQAFQVIRFILMLAVTVDQQMKAMGWTLWGVACPSVCSLRSRMSTRGIALLLFVHLETTIL